MEKQFSFPLSALTAHGWSPQLAKCGLWLHLEPCLPPQADECPCDPSPWPVQIFQVTYWGQKLLQPLPLGLMATLFLLHSQLQHSF